MTLDELPEDFTPEQFRQLDRASLDKVPYTRLFWPCHATGCTCGTHVRDYGIAPWYFLDRNSKNSHSYPYLYWQQVPPMFWMCGRHNKLWKRLCAAHYSFGHIAKRMFGGRKPPAPYAQK